MMTATTESHVVRITMIPMQPVQVTSSPVSRRDICRGICRRCAFEVPWVTSCQGWLVGWCGMIRRSRKIRNRGFWCLGPEKSEAIFRDLLIQHTLIPIYQFSRHQTVKGQPSFLQPFSFGSLQFSAQEWFHQRITHEDLTNIPGINVIKVFVLLEGIAMVMWRNWEWSGTLLWKWEWNSTLEHEVVWARRRGKGFVVRGRRDLCWVNNPNPSVLHL